MADGFVGVDAVPYRWPFDGCWSSGDTALLLLGFQAGPVEALAAEAEVAVAARLAAAAAAAGVTVVASRRRRSDDGSAMSARRSRLGDRPPAQATPGWQLAAGLALPAGTIVIDHDGDNALFGTGLGDLLAGRGIRNLLCAGLPTDGLLHASQRTANDMGFECLAIADACKGTTAERHDSQLSITTFGNGLFGAVASSGAVLAALARQPA